MDRLDERRLRLLGMGNIGYGNRHALQRIVGPRRRERKDVTQIRRRLVAFGQRIEAPSQLDRLQHGGVIDRSPFGAKHRAGCDARRDEQRGDAHAEPLEVEIELADRVIRRCRVRGRRHVIVIAAVLVVSDQQQRICPAWPVSYRVVGIVNQQFAERDIVVGVLTVAAGAEARLEKGVGRKRAVLAPGLKIPEMAEMALVGVLGIGEIQPRQRIAIVAIDRPVDVLCAEPAENARAGKNFD